MTDKTDALRARELLAAEYTKRGMGVDFVNDAGTPTAIALAAIREALAAAPAAPKGGVVEPGQIRALVTAANAVLAANPADDTMWTLEAAVAPFNAKKPDECANGCPPYQVCDYCLTAALANQEQRHD